MTSRNYFQKAYQLGASDGLEEQVIAILLEKKKFRSYEHKLGAVLNEIKRARSDKVKDLLKTYIDNLLEFQETSGYKRLSAKGKEAVSKHMQLANKEITSRFNERISKLESYTTVSQGNDLEAQADEPAMREPRRLYSTRVKTDPSAKVSYLEAHKHAPLHGYTKKTAPDHLIPQKPTKDEPAQTTDATRLQEIEVHAHRPSRTKYFGTIPAHLQPEMSPGMKGMIEFLEADLSPNPVAAKAHLRARQPGRKNNWQARILTMAGAAAVALGAYVLNEYLAYKNSPLGTHVSTVATTRVASPTTINTSPAIEYASNNAEIELPMGLNFVSLSNSADSNQIRSPEKKTPAIQDTPVDHTSPPVHNKSLENKLSNWFSQLSKNTGVFVTRLNRATKRIAQEYELMREEPQRHFNMEKTLAHGLRVDTAAPQLSDESFTVRVGPAEDEAEMPARVKRGIPSNYWPVESPLKSGIGAPLVVYYNAGNSKHISPETQTVESSPNPKPLSNEWFEKIKAKHKLAGKN